MLRFSLGALLPLVAALPAAAFSLTAGGYSNDFSVKPGSGDFSTRLVSGAAVDITTPEALDLEIQSISFDTVNVALLDAAIPPATAGLGQYSADLDKILTRPTGVRASILMATVTNNTGSTLSGLIASYDYGRIGNVLGEQVDGHRFYLSTTGAVNSWTAAGTFGTPGPVSIPTALSVAPGDSFYLLWADDNGSLSPDDGLTIDNLSITPALAVPEPSAALLSLLCLGGLALHRRR